MHIIINEYFKTQLAEQLEKDANFLANHGINDYSLLLGLHNIKSDINKNDYQTITTNYLYTVCKEDNNIRQIPFYQVLKT